jgi:alpha-tubulin suppressor-like RCC1 family protein
MGGSSSSSSDGVRQQQGAVRVAAGRSVSVALMADGSAVAWRARAECGAITRVLFNASSGSPSPIGGLPPPPAASGAARVAAIAIAAGGAHALALLSNGTVVQALCDSSAAMPLPRDVAASGSDHAHGATQGGKARVLAVSAGLNFSLALMGPEGRVVAWGTGGWHPSLYDVPAAARAGVVAISAGYTHAVAVKADGTLVVWGEALHRQLEVSERATGWSVGRPAGPCVAVS